MVYIHRKRVKDKSYYYLRMSVRRNGKVITKDLSYLGNELNDKVLEKIKKDFSKEIRDSYKTIQKTIEETYYDTKVRKKKLKHDEYLKTNLVDVEVLKEHFYSRYMKLDGLTQKEVMEQFASMFSVNSAAIEGNTITIAEAKLFFEENIMPKNKKIEEVYDLINSKKAFNFICDKKPELTESIIKKVQNILLDRIDDRKDYRTWDVRVFGAGFKSSPFQYIKADMEALIKWYKDNKKKIHPVVLSAMFHHKFERIHPFPDGNGRTGRMLANLILMNEEYPPLVISRLDRKKYLDALRMADSGTKKDLFAVEPKSYSSLIEFFVEQYKKSYWELFLV